MTRKINNDAILCDNVDGIECQICGSSLVKFWDVDKIYCAVECDICGAIEATRVDYFSLVD